jgi:hypothetical protein
MLSRLCSLASVLLIAALLTTTASAKDKNKKPLLSPFILRAHTVVVVIDPDAGEPLDEPNANASARTAVEKALLEWGRFDLLSQGQETDLIIVVRTGNGKLMRPTVKGGPIDQRPVSGESTDSTIHIGAQHGQPPPLQGNSIPDPDPNRGPHVNNEVGPSEDMFEVYRGNVPDPLDSMSIWRYIAKDCLREPKVTAVEEFRKAIAEAEKPKIPATKP